MRGYKRRAERISVELPVKVYFFDNKEKIRIGDSLAGRIKNFSPLGAGLTVPTIQLNGQHLFYTCQDDPDVVLELEFELNGEDGNIITVHAAPAWFDKDLDSDQKQFDVGLKFMENPRSPEIKALSKEACKDEKRLVALWKMLF